MSQGPAESLVKDFSIFAEDHLQYEVWRVSREVDRTVQACLTELPDPGVRSVLQDFWACGVVEFHLYFLTPVLSVTTCDSGTVKWIAGLNLKSVTGNGIPVGGIAGFPEERASRRSLDATRAVVRAARMAYGYRGMLAALADRPSAVRARYAVLAPAPDYGEAIAEVLGPEARTDAIFLSHNPATWRFLREKLPRDRVWPIRNEFPNAAGMSGMGKALQFVGRAIEKVESTCQRHGVVLSGEVLREIWLNFVATRWPAYLGFNHSARSISAALKESGVTTFILGQERNMRERVWCRRLREQGIISRVVEPCLYDSNAEFAYRFEADEVLVDSDFTARQLIALGHSPEQVRGVGHAGVSLLRRGRLDGENRRSEKGRRGFPIDRPLVLYGTQSVSDGTSNSMKDTSDSLNRVKTDELAFMLKMAERFNFHLLIKPHRNEQRAYYQSLVRDNPRVTIFPSSHPSRDVIRFADCVVTRWSTLSYEAMSIGIPTFFLNFYQGQPRLACFRDLAHWVARNVDEAEGKFAHFWGLLHDPKTSEQIREWASSQGWDPQAEVRIKAAIDGVGNT